MRLAIMLLALLFVVAILAYVWTMIRRVWARIKAGMHPNRPGLVAPLRGRMPTLGESSTRLSALRPRETASLVRLLTEITGDFTHADGAKWEVEASVMADVVDPVLRMLEALRPHDTLPDDAIQALAAATARIETLRNTERARRVAAAREEAKEIMSRLKIG